MKVAMIISRFPPHVGGTENQALRLARQLVKRGVDVDVITQRHHPSLAVQDTIDGVRVLRTGAAGSTLWSALTFLLQGMRVMSKQTKMPDIFHGHMIAAPAVLSCFAAARWRKPAIVKVACSGYLGDIQSSKQSLLGRAKLAYVLSKATRLVSVSNDIQTELKMEGIDPSKIVSIPNGVDIDEFQPISSYLAKNSILDQLQMPRGRWFLFSGRVTQQKRPLDLLNAFSKVAATLPDARLLYIGEGDQRAELVSRIRSKGLQERVFVRDPVKDIRPYYHAVDVFVLPSEAEGLSNSLLEAMASGLVCVASRVGGIIDVIDDGKDGYLFSGDTDALAEALLRSLSDPARNEAVKLVARKKVIDSFSLSAVAEKYEALYANLLAHA